MLNALALAVQIAAAPVAAPIAVVGVGDVDGTSTVIGFADGAFAPRCTVEHRRGFVVPGVVVDDHRVALVVADNVDRGGGVVVLDLQTCAQRVLFDEASIWRAPVLVPTKAATKAGTAVVAVRVIGEEADGALFEVVSADVDGGAAVVRTARRALWVTPLAGASSFDDLAFLVGENGEHDGEFHVDRVVDGDLVAFADLGRGVFKSGVVAFGSVFVEVVDGDRSDVVRVKGAAKDGVAAGLAGKDVVTGFGHVAFGSGDKDGSVIVDGARIKGVRAGLARPRVVDDDGGVGVSVVVWVDRGASLPGELWSMTTNGAGKRLLPPQPRTAVQVYGVAPTKKPTTPKKAVSK